MSEYITRIIDGKVISLSQFYKGILDKFFKNYIIKA